jgi:hypothetical protein
VVSCVLAARSLCSSNRSASAQRSYRGVMSLSWEGGLNISLIRKYSGRYLLRFFDWAGQWAKTGQVFCGGVWWVLVLSSRSRMGSPTVGREMIHGCKCFFHDIRIGKVFTVRGDREQ